MKESFDVRSDTLQDSLARSREFRDAQEVSTSDKMTMQRRPCLLKRGQVDSLSEPERVAGAVSFPLGEEDDSAPNVHWIRSPSMRE